MPATTVIGHWDVYELLHRHRSGEERPLERSILPGLRAGDVGTVLFAVGGDSRSHAGGSDLPLRGCLETMHVALEALETSEGVGVAWSREELEATERAGNVAFVLVLEGGRPLEGSMALLHQFYRLGVRCLLPTWNGRNELGAGVGEGPDHGLSRFGREVVREMRRLGMLLDLSHLARRGFYDAIEEHGGTVVATHSNAAALHDHPRNLDDDQIRALAETGGVIGIAFMPAFLGPGQPTIETIVDHVAFVAELVGIEHVGIGPDFSYGPVAAEHKRHRRYEGVRVDLDVPYPIPDASALPALASALRRRGLSEVETAAVMGGNLRRVLCSVLPTRAPAEG